MWKQGNIKKYRRTIKANRHLENRVSVVALLENEKRIGRILRNSRGNGVKSPNNERNEVTYTNSVIDVVINRSSTNNNIYG